MRELARHARVSSLGDIGVNSHRKTVGSVTHEDTKSRSRKRARTTIHGEIRGSTRRPAGRPAPAAHFNAPLIATCRVLKSRAGTAEEEEEEDGGGGR